MADHLTREDLDRLQALLSDTFCTLGRYEYDMARYCYEHGGFVNYLQDIPLCDKHPARQDPAWAAYETRSRANAARTP